MPTDKVQYKYDEIGEIASKTAAHADGSVRIRSMLEQQLDVLMSGGWEGRAAKAHFDEMQRLMLPAVQRLEQIFEAISAALRRASDMMQDAEQQAAGLFRGDGGGGFFGDGGVLDRMFGGGGSQGGSPGGSIFDRLFGTGGGGGAGTTAAPGTPLSEKIKFIGKFFDVADKGGSIIDKLKNVDVWGKRLGWAGPVGDIFNLVSGGVAAWESDTPVETGFEKGVGFALEKVIERHPIGMAILFGSDAIQLGGTGLTAAATQFNELHNDARLAESIRNFEANQKNADVGNVIDGVSSMIVDFGQAGIGGAQEVFNNPTPLNVMQALTPGGLFAMGFSDTDMLKEFGKNTLMTLGHTGDFVVGVSQLGPRLADLGQNSMRLGLQDLGFSQGFSETSSDIVGGIAKSVLSAGNPLGVFSTFGSPIDFSDSIKSLFD